MPVTVTPSAMVTPPARAPLASDMVMSDGEAWPSVGEKRRADDILDLHQRPQLLRLLRA